MFSTYSGVFKFIRFYRYDVQLECQYYIDRYNYGSSGTVTTPDCSFFVAAVRDRAGLGEVRQGTKNRIGYSSTSSDLYGICNSRVRIGSSVHPVGAAGISNLSS